MILLSDTKRSDGGDQQTSPTKSYLPTEPPHSATRTTCQLQCASMFCFKALLPVDLSCFLSCLFVHELSLKRSLSTAVCYLVCYYMAHSITNFSPQPLQNSNPMFTFMVEFPLNTVSRTSIQASHIKYFQ